MTSRRKFLAGAGAASILLPAIARAVPSGTTPPISPRLTPVPLQVVATRGRIPQNPESNSSSYTRFESYIKVTLGPRPVESVRTAFCARMNTGANEAPNYNSASISAFQLESSIYPAGLSPIPMTFGGVLNPTISPGASLVISDPAGYPLPAGMQVKLQSGAVVAAGSTIPGAGNNAGNGPLYYGYDSASATSQVNLDSTWSMPSGGASAYLGFIPLMVLGIPDQPHVAVAIWGDSICWGTGDTNGDTTTGCIGWAERSMIGASRTAAGVAVTTPFVNLSRSGSTTAVYVSRYTQTCFAVLPYVSHVICALSTNDVGSQVLATIQANCQAAWTAARNAGCRVYHTTMTPHTTSTDSWATAANQTIVAGYESAFTPGVSGTATSGAGLTGTRGAFNAWLAAQVIAGNLDGVLDVNAAIEDAGNPGKWQTNGSANWLTGDGLHPLTAGHVAIAAAEQPVVAAWSV